jgi:hypothetical protein
LYYGRILCKENVGRNKEKKSTKRDKDGINETKKLRMNLEN